MSGNPTGPVTVATAPQRRLRRQPGAPVRVRRARRRAASTTSTTPAARSTSSASRCGRARRAPSRPRTATRASTWPRSRPSSASIRTRRRRRVGAGRHRGDDRAHPRHPGPLPRARSTTGSSSARCTRAGRWSAPSTASAPAATSTSRTGRLWLRSTELGDDKDRVLVRSDGTPTYVAGDLAYIVDKLERGFDTAVYVLGADHHGYIGRLKAARPGARLRPRPDRRPDLPAGAT